MKVVDKIREEILVEDLIPGDGFKWGDSYYIVAKLDYHFIIPDRLLPDKYIIVMNLSNGAILQMDRWTVVRRIGKEIVVI